MKLWGECDEAIEKFTVGNDYLLDKALVKYDCIASIAHAKVLHKNNILTGSELEQVELKLSQIIEAGIEIKQSDEDCHTAIENHLGELGKKIHCCRSRNDQVLTALRMYEKDKLAEIKSAITEFADKLNALAGKYGKIPMPGYTHTRKAMPTTVEVWLNSFANAAEDDLLLISAAETLIDQSPLGTAAGFGVPEFNMHREHSAKDCGFSKPMKNPMYAQMSRGKFESSIIHALTQVMFTLNKLSADVIFFSEKGYVVLPEEICTGSSIMPQKKNPDVFELVRGKYHLLLGEEMKVKSLISNLISGYNRDIQLTKECVMKSFDTALGCLEILNKVIPLLQIDETQCKKELTPEIYATEKAYKLVKKGVSFREAYRTIKRKYNFL